MFHFIFLILIYSSNSALIFFSLESLDELLSVQMVFDFHLITWIHHSLKEDVGRQFWILSNIHRIHIHYIMVGCTVGQIFRLDLAFNSSEPGRVMFRKIFVRKNKCYSLNKSRLKGYTYLRIMSTEIFFVHLLIIFSFT